MKAIWIENNKRETLCEVIEIGNAYTELEIIEGRFEGKRIVVHHNFTDESIRFIREGKIESVKRQLCFMVSPKSGKDVRSYEWEIKIDDITYYLHEDYLHEWDYSKGHTYQRIIKTNTDYIGDNITQAKRNLISNHKARYTA